EAGEHDDGQGRARAEELYREDLRRTREDDRAHAERTEKVRSGGSRADAAHEPERREPEVGGHHFSEARAEIAVGEDVSQRRRQLETDVCASPASTTRP